MQNKSQVYCVVQNEDGRQTLISKKKETSRFSKGKVGVEWIVNQAGQYAPLAGGGQGEEDALTASKRELKQECGIDIDDYRPKAEVVGSFWDSESATTYNLVIYTVNNSAFDELKTKIADNISPEVANPNKPAGRIRDWESDKVEVVQTHLLPIKLGFPQLVSIENEEKVDKNSDSQSITWYATMATTVQQRFIKAQPNNTALEQEGAKALSKAQEALKTVTEERERERKTLDESKKKITNTDFRNSLGFKSTITTPSSTQAKPTTSQSSMPPTKIDQGTLQFKPRGQQVGGKTNNSNKKNVQISSTPAQQHPLVVQGLNLDNNNNVTNTPQQPQTEQVIPPVQAPAQQQQIAIAPAAQQSTQVQPQVGNEYGSMHGVLGNNPQALVELRQAVQQMRTHTPTPAQNVPTLTNLSPNANSSKNRMYHQPTQK